MENLKFLFPLEGQQVELFFRGNREFTGAILSTREERYPTSIEVEVDCVDYTYWFDRLLVVEEYPIMSLQQMVRNIVNDFSEGFTTVNVKGADITIPAQKFDYVRPSSALDTIAVLANYIWFFDFNRDLHFIPFAGASAPKSFICLDVETEIFDVKVAYSLDQIVNRIYIKDARTKSKDTYSEAQRTSDGVTDFMALGYDPSSLSDTEVIINKGQSNEKTYSVSEGNLKLDLVDGQPGDDATASPNDDCFVCLDNRGVRFAPGHIPTLGDTIDIDYKFLNDKVIVVEDPDSIDFVKQREGPPSTGIYESVINAPDLIDVTDESVAAFGELILNRQANPREKGAFSVYGAGWQAGQVFILESARRHGGFERKMVILEVSKEFLNNDTVKNLVSFAATLYGE